MATHAVTATAAILDNEMGRTVTRAMKEPPFMEETGHMPAPIAGTSDLCAAACLTSICEKHSSLSRGHTNTES